MGLILNQHSHCRLSIHSTLSVNLLLPIISFFLIACSGSAVAPAPEVAVSGSEETDSENDDLETLSIPNEMAEAATVFVALRAERGQFSGGSWNPEVDQWDGAKHQAMQSLATALGERQYDQTAVLRLLGRPDERILPADPIYQTLITPEADPVQATEILIYYWRGDHDYLYLLMEGETVSAVHWWYAGE